MGKRNEDRQPKEMAKPKYKIGEIVDATFINEPVKVELLTLSRNKNAHHRWVYKGIVIEGHLQGTKLSCIGVDGSEQWTNIVTKVKK